MKEKRTRSVNWDEKEKQLFCTVLKDYTQVLENKALDTNSISIKNKAWEDIHKKFNELNGWMNGRSRDLSQLKLQWKTIKKARKSLRIKESNETGGFVIEIKDLAQLNSAVLYTDHNINETDGNITQGSINDATQNEKLGTTSNKKDAYVNSTLSHSKQLKDEEHQMKMNILKIETDIQKEKLKSAILEREILELKKKAEQKKHKEMFNND